MPGFSHRLRSAAGAVAACLAAVFAAGATHPAPFRPAGHAARPAGGGGGRAPASGSAPGRLAFGSGRSPLRPGGPLSGGRGPAPAFARYAGGGLASSNWAGYAATRTLAPFRFVEAVFFVPYLDCAGTPGSYSAHWVGLDGVDTHSVEQAGVLAACVGSTPRYAAWWEMFPKLPVYPKLTVRAGDSVVASVYYRRADKTFTLTLADTTTGKRFSVVRACPEGVACLRGSAEVISEAPSSNGRLLPLADFRALSYSGVKVTDQNGHRAGLRSRWWSSTSITMVNPATGAALAQPTQLYRGSAFDVYWLGGS